VKKKIVRRFFDSQIDHNLHSLHPVLQRIYLARNVRAIDDLDYSLSKLPSPWLLWGMEEMVTILADAVINHRKIVVVADFDADGATGCAVAILGLRLLGLTNLSYVVPNRFEFGYGLTPELVEASRTENPELLLTVDNGISSLEGVNAARKLGWKVLITDHHLPGEALPEADAIVNPNLPGDEFPSKSLAGVGVMFYVLMALRTRLRDIEWFRQSGKKEPNLAQLLDFVALGTVADLVPLDRINRILVQQGLQRICANQTHPGILALLAIAKRSNDSVVSSDFAFAVAPRLNAAGRLEDMSLGIECLLTDDSEVAERYAFKLDQLNGGRREIEEKMKIDAFGLNDKMEFSRDMESVSGICLYDKGWHQGIIGILASRIKERFHRPVVAFAPTSNNEIKGSARSISGIHIRDVLCDIAAKYPDLIKSFGGHAMAAGLTLNAGDYPAFTSAFERVVDDHLSGIDRFENVYTDGVLGNEFMVLEFAETLRKSGPWGQGFPEPLFEGEFEVIQTRILKERHLKLLLKLSPENLLDGIVFFIEQPESWLRCRFVKIVYRLDVNEYRSLRTPQLMIENIEDISDKGFRASTSWDVHKGGEVQEVIL